MNLEGEGSFKLGGETYNIKVIVTKQEKLKNEKNALSKVMGFLDKTFSSLKTNQEEKTEISINIRQNKNALFMLAL